MRVSLILVIFILFELNTSEQDRSTDTKRLRELLVQLQEKLEHRLQGGHSQRPPADKKRPALSPDQLGETGLEEALQTAQNGKDEQRTRRKATSDTRRLWPQAIIPFILQQSISEAGKKNVLKAMKIWERDTCLQFVNYRPEYHPKALGHRSYLHIVFQEGSCTANHGRSLHSDAVKLYAGTSCLDAPMSLVHELGHVIGLVHEQSRPDRDQYITINRDKVEPSRLGNFDIVYSEGFDPSMPYDFDSIMHYGCTLFSKKPNDITIQTKDAGFQGVIGQRTHLSYYDVKIANDMYQCKEAKRLRRSSRLTRQASGCGSELQCLNEGYVGYHCKCVCPPALEGKRCDEVPASNAACGGVLTAPQGTFTSPNFPHWYPAKAECHWLIQGQKDSIIKLKFEKFDIEPDNPRCEFDRLEIREKGPHMAGKRYCGNSLPSVEYHGSGLYVYFSSDDREEYDGFKVTYTIESNKPTGTWSDWTEWSPCAVTCGSGVILRSRKCLSLPCQGPDMDVKMCFKQC